MEVDVMPRMLGARLWTAARTTAAGLLAAESWRFTEALRPILTAEVAKQHHETAAIFIATFGVVLLAFYAYRRAAVRTALLILKSDRLDVLISFGSGVALSVLFNGFLDAWYKRIASALLPDQIAALAALPMIWFLSIVITEAIRNVRRNKMPYDAFFVSDKEIIGSADDLLATAEDAKRFADRVFNLGSPDSLSFGIDAPWGIGKSSFVNFCIEHWSSQYKTSVVVYQFKPLQFEGRTNLLEHFIDGLVAVIQENEFQPEAQRLIAQYSRYLKGAKTSVYGIDLDLTPSSYSPDDALRDLNEILSDFHKQIVVVIDDLDRLAFSAVKDVLFAIKKSFALPRITYVFCYDTDNIGSLEDRKPETDKISEFFEKFINVKVSLYLSGNTIARYATDNLKAVLSGNSQADPALVSRAMGGLIDICRSSTYYEYRPYIGDVRKIKRLINTLVFLQIETTDFEIADFNKEDLIHLLLVHINYPNVFRDIYASEGSDRGALFSAVGPYDPEFIKSPALEKRESPFQNSKKYSVYRDALTPNAKFLIEKLFNVEHRLGKTPAYAVTDATKHTFGCFNGGIGTGANLRQYLALIVKLAKPQNSTQYTFYIARKDEVKSGQAIAEVLRQPEFQGPDAEHVHDRFWRLITNSAREFNKETAEAIIRHLMATIHTYGFLQPGDSERGLRNTLPLFLIKLLDERGWSDSSGSSIDNNAKHLEEIVEWVFGTNRHANEGVIQSLASPQRGVLGLYDLLVFRLYCCADRGGDWFNLQRALSADSDPDAPTSGLTQTIAIGEMRKLSQTVFAWFSSIYVAPKKNLFTLVQSLRWEDWAGTARSQSDGESERVAMEAAKSKVIMFVLYQLGSRTVGSGVPCGYYDEEGKSDANGISTAINSYLFDVCFNPKSGSGRLECFVHYLLLNLSRAAGGVFEVVDGEAKMRNLTTVLDRAALLQFWRAHRYEVLSLDLAASDKTLIVGKEEIVYREAVPGLFRLLDDMTLGRSNGSHSKDRDLIAVLMAIKDLAVGNGCESDGGLMEYLVTVGLSSAANFRPPPKLSVAFM